MVLQQQQHQQQVGANKHILSALQSQPNTRAFTLASSLQQSSRAHELALTSLGRFNNQATMNRNSASILLNNSTPAATSTPYQQLKLLAPSSTNNTNQSLINNHTSQRSSGLNLSSSNNPSSISSPTNSSNTGHSSSVLSNSSCLSCSSSQSSINSDSLASSYQQHHNNPFNSSNNSHNQHNSFNQTTQPTPLNTTNQQSSAQSSGASLINRQAQITPTSPASSMQANQQQQQQQQPQNSSRYKTELCRPFEENGTCKYGEKCQFAHGMPELRTLARHPKYKTEFCRTFHTTGFCPYGPRCHFIHNGRGPAPNMNSSDSSLAASLASHQQQLAVGQDHQQHLSTPISSSQSLAKQTGPVATKTSTQSPSKQDIQPNVTNSLSSSPVSSVNCSSVSSCSSSSGKGSSVCSPPSCSESPPALSSSPDSSMLGSSSISSSPNHHHTHHQLQQLSIGRRAPAPAGMLPFGCSLGDQLSHQLIGANTGANSTIGRRTAAVRDAPGLSLASGHSGSPFFGSLSANHFVTNAIGCENNLINNRGKTIGSSRDSDSANSSASNGSSRDETCDSSHAFLWLHSQLNSGQTTPVQSISPINQTLNNLGLDSSPVSDDKQHQQHELLDDSTATSKKQQSNSNGDNSCWPLCSNLAMSPSSVAAARRTWQMQA